MSARGPKSLPDSPLPAGSVQERLDGRPGKEPKFVPQRGPLCPLPPSYLMPWSRLYSSQFFFNFMKSERLVLRRKGFVGFSSPTVEWGLPP